jgi:hypothetical protein
MIAKPVRLWLGWVAITITLLANGLRADEAYRINLTPSAHVGESYRYVASETEHKEKLRILPTAAQTPSSVTDARFDLDSVVDVLRCDSNGRPAKLHFTVGRFQFSPNGRDLLPEGSAFDADNGPATEGSDAPVDRFMPMNFRPHPILDTAFHKVITIGNATDATDQQLFGTEQRLPVGGNWPLDGKPGAQLFAKMNIKADPKKVTGRGRLAGIQTIGQAQYLEVRLSVATDDPLQADDGGRVVNGRTTGELIEWIALDSGQTLDAQYKTYVFSDAVHSGLKFDYTIRSSVTITREIQIAQLKAGAWK